MKLRVVASLIAVMFASMAGYHFTTLPAILPLEAKFDENALRVTTANIYYKNSQAEALTGAILDTKADVIVIPEWQPERLMLERLKQGGYEIALHHAATGTHGIGVIVRRGLKVDAQLVESPVFGPCRMPLATVRVRYHSSFVTVVGVHVPPPIPACEETTDPTITSIGEWIQDGRLIHSIGAGRAGDSVIVAGDFNAFSFNVALKGLVERGLVDTYADTESGYGPTWAPFSWLPSLFRIDYIFSSGRFSAISSHTVELPGSDHRAVVSDIAIKEEIGLTGDMLFD